MPSSSDEDDVVCSKCRFLIGSDVNALTCSDCDRSYHLGECSGVSESTYKSKKDGYKKAWRCPSCKPGKCKGDQAGKNKPDLDVARLLADINRKLDSLEPLKVTVDNIEKKIQEVSKQYDDVLKNQIRQDKEIKELRKRMDAAEKANPANEIERLQSEISDLEWQSRKLNLEVHGVIKTENENLLDKVNEVASRLQLPPLTTNDVVAMHRLPAKPDKVPHIIIRFTRQTTKEQWLQNKKKLFGTKPDVFIVENMTKKNRELLWKAKEWAKGAGFRYVWHRSGSIFARKKDGDRPIVVRSEDDLLRCSR